VLIPILVQLLDRKCCPCIPLCQPSSGARAADISDEWYPKSWIRHMRSYSSQSALFLSNQSKGRSAPQSPSEPLPRPILRIADLLESTQVAAAAMATTQPVMPRAFPSSHDIVGPLLIGLALSCTIFGILTQQSVFACSFKSCHLYTQIAR